MEIEIGEKEIEMEIRDRKRSSVSEEKRGNKFESLKLALHWPANNSPTRVNKNIWKIWSAPGYNAIYWRWLPAQIWTIDKSIFVLE